MTWYWGRWSQILQKGVEAEEARDPSSITIVNKLYCSTTTITKEFWSEDQFIKNLDNYLKLKCAVSTANLLDVMIGQRMSYDVTKLKAFIQKLRSRFPHCKFETSPEGIYLKRK